MNRVTPTQIKDLRGHYGLSQRALGRLLGWGEITVHRYEAGTPPDGVHSDLLMALQDPIVMRHYISGHQARLTALDRRNIEAVLERDTASEAAAVLRRGLLVLMDQYNDLQRGNRAFDFDQLGRMVVFFTSRAATTRTKLLKLLFYSDFLAFKVYHRSLSGTPYRKFPFGPVPDHYELLLMQLETEGLITSESFIYQSPDGPQPGSSYQASREVDGIALSETDGAVLATVATRLFPLNAKRIAERSHQEIAWRETDDRGLIPYALAGTLSLDLPQSVKLSNSTSNLDRG